MTVLEQRAYEAIIKMARKDEPDYWEKLLHQYAGMAMQGILANYGVEPLPDDAADDAYNYATALVEKFKKDSYD